MSLALNGRPGVAASTRERVLAAAEELGYRPNLIARRLFAQETGILGVLFHDLSGFFMAQILRGINQEAAARGYSVILSVSERRLERERETLDLLVGEQVDGIILCTTAPLDGGQHLEQFKSRQIPMVLVDRYLDNVQTDYVVSDNEAGAYQLIEHLLDAGHQRIGVVAPNDPASSVRDRVRGCMRALSDRGASGDDRLVKRVSIFSDQGLIRNLDSLYGALDELMQEETPPTAVVTMSSDLTPAALGWLKRRGIRMPEDVALVGFDQVPLLSSLEIHLTTIAQSPFLMGISATRLLLDRIAGKDGAEGQVKIPTALVEGPERGSLGAIVA